MFYHVCCVNRKETIKTKKKTKYFFSPAFTVLVSSLWLTLLNLLLNNLPLSLEGPLNCICAHANIRENVFIQKNIDHIHNYVQKSFSTAWKVSKYRVFSGPYFPAFGLNTEIYLVNLRIQSKCGKIRTRKNSPFGHFSRSARLKVSLGHCLALP